MAIVLLATSSWQILAQDMSGVQGPVEQAAESLRVGDLIRVLVSDGPRVQGILTRYEWPEIHLADGARIGALAGVLVGVAMGMFVGEVICDNPDCRADTAGAALAYGALGTVVGTGSGALIGLAVHRWDQRFP